MAATWMARLGVSCRIVDKRGTKIFAGQADGLQCRSLEIFDSFGFADRVWKEANHMLEICMWVGTFPYPDIQRRDGERVLANNSRTQMRMANSDAPIESPIPFPDYLVSMR